MRNFVRRLKTPRHHAVALLSIFSTSSSLPISGICRKNYCKPLCQGTLFRSQHQPNYSWNQQRHIVVGRRSISLHEKSSISNNNNSPDPISLAQDAFNVLARKGRSWRRLGHLVDLVVEGHKNSTTGIISVADIGCDHGLLSVGLSVTGCFDRVTGVDVSQQALENGAISLHEEVLSILRTKTEEQSEGRDYDATDQYLIPVEFRVGDGLKILQPGEADAVCIAGMGINTMLKILTDTELSRLDCQQLILQPTNTKPRNLVQLYDDLQNMGWVVKDERIEELSSRFYISTRFEKKETSDLEESAVLPGEILNSLKDGDPMSKLYNEYVQLHLSWLDGNLEKAGRLHDGELRWLNSNR